MGRREIQRLREFRASANLLTMAALKELHGGGEIIVPPITWVSDIASVLQCGFRPVFVDIDPRTLGMDNEQILEKITPETRAVFLTQCSATTPSPTPARRAARRGIPLIEDVCESHGATFAGRRLGSLGLISNFSFYYAHHLSTIEGGMVCTNDENIYETVRMLRSHGMVRETALAGTQTGILAGLPGPEPGFHFRLPRLERPQHGDQRHHRPLAAQAPR